MTNFPDRDRREFGYDYGSIATGSPMWIIGAVAVVLVFGAFMYGLSGSGSVHVPSSPGAIEQPTQPPAPATPKP